MKTEVITIGIHKGGTGKSSTAAIIAQAAAADGKRVLCVDLDRQGNCSYAIAADRSEDTGSTFDLLTGTPAKDVIQTTPQGLDAIPASRDLETIQGGRGAARRLQNALEPIKKKYDVIVIDTPTNGILLHNALQASTGLLIPVEADTYNLESLQEIVSTAEAIRDSNPALQVKGIIITKYDGRSIFARQMRDNAINEAAEMGLPCLGTVRMGIAVKEAAYFQESLFDYAPKSNPAADYMEIYKALYL